MNGDKWNDTWWREIVAICEQGRGNENGLLQNYRLIFIALETVVLAAAFSQRFKSAPEQIVLGITGAILAIIWIVTCEKRSQAVDVWENMLCDLWKQKNLGISAHYYRAKSRKTARAEIKQWFDLAGHAKRFWKTHDDPSLARWVLNLILPVLVLGVSMSLIYKSSRPWHTPEIVGFSMSIRKGCIAFGTLLACGFLWWLLSRKK